VILLIGGATTSGGSAQGRTAGAASSQNRTASAASQAGEAAGAPRRVALPVASPAAGPKVRRVAPPRPRLPAPSGVDESRVAMAVLGTLDAERHAHGLASLRMDAELISSAHQHDLTMAAQNEMSHQLPGEAVFSTRISDAGYDWSSAGENIGWNSVMTTAGARQLEYDMYDEGPPPAGQINHYANIVNHSYQDVGIDVWYDNVHHKLWLTEDFGAPR
jgi:uncharacterized protein YkwD